MLKVESLACRRSLRLVFRDVAFEVDRGALMVVTGANGSGKSTLLRALAGLLPISDGSIFWNGASTSLDDGAHRERLCYVGHHDAVKPELTVSETLAYWSALLAVGPARSDAFGVNALADKPVRYLSAGQKRRLALTRLLMSEAPLWLLDEPTTALDQAAQGLLADAITAHRAKGGIVIAAMHHEMNLPDMKIFRMPEGRA